MISLESLPECYTISVMIPIMDTSLTLYEYASSTANNLPTVNSPGNPDVILDHSKVQYLRVKLGTPYTKQDPDYQNPGTHEVSSTVIVFKVTGIAEMSHTPRSFVHAILQFNQSTRCNS